MPAIIPIPPFEATGVLPPVIGSPTVPGSQAPYRVSLVDVVRRFSGSEERRAILRGFLAYRAELHAVGLTQGFQWLDGSFAEQIELLEDRSPKDIDVVTFPQSQPHSTQAAQAIELFKPQAMKDRFRCDAYGVPPGLPAYAATRHATYWYALFSHRRDRRWKGMLEIDLAPVEDAAALEALAELERGT